MPINVGDGGVEWKLVAPFPPTHVHAPEAEDVYVGLRREEWDLSSDSQAGSIGERGDGDSNGNGKDTVLQDRVQRILSQWEERETRVIVKWGSVGVKSEAYMRVRRFQTMKKKQQEELRQQLKKLRQVQRKERRQKEERSRMAANARARHNGS
ncbi:hypothetical protein TraAM80_04329 [Trypanosoma rangeli]|uniref:Uncharacterized protein n=1 Tax=Trypanosoma rangeli TaxID=5698 RepID=A0A422NK07_TRYRA|nr:uncharacterized protein TraAM80_04329 [Trypanosoma rangeli]RNF05796.1 hypothetical protein TraAM80_04329 [Trypanosoma rangeli]|eukprot:RNF05796.1 hypothetical protein TraAM80_04329 [Trypanosoma rangeli]